jgi:hypothetical protein
MNRNFENPERFLGRPDAMVAEGAAPKLDNRQMCPNETKLAGSCRAGNRCPVIIITDRKLSFLPLSLPVRFLSTVLSFVG